MYLARSSAWGRDLKPRLLKSQKIHTLSSGARRLEQQTCRLLPANPLNAYAKARWDHPDDMRKRLQAKIYPESSR
ncbi:MAG: hypothetical protein R6U22_11040 [Desulfohalobiaceae bacterium]